MASRFLDDKVPAQWEEVGYPSLKPLRSWVPDLILRVEFLSKWLYEGPPRTYWVPAFFFPQGFMTAALQSYARKSQIAIDALTFKSNIANFFEDSIKEEPENGVNIHGLYLQGARWNFQRSYLEDSEPKKGIVNFPVVWLQPVDVSDNLE